MNNYKLYVASATLLTFVIAIGCKTHYQTNIDNNYTAVPTSGSMENGKNLLANMCGGCHYDKKVDKYIGGAMHDVPSIMGKVYAANLTSSKTNGIMAHYTDAQLRYLLKTCIARDGRFIPYMPRPNLSDADMNDLIVYLRSNDGPVAAADTTVGITDYTLIGKFIIHMASKPLPYRSHVAGPRPGDNVAYGRYLVDNVGCFHCHSAGLTKLNYLNPEATDGYLAGGEKFKTPQGKKIYASNITFDKATGIGNYNQVQFRKAVQDGEGPTGKISLPMPRFHELTDKQTDAIFAYLRSFPPKEHAVKGH